MALVRPDGRGTYGDGGNAPGLRQRLLLRGIAARAVRAGVAAAGPERADSRVLGAGLARNPALADLLLGWVVGDLAPLELASVDRLRAQRLAAVSGAGRGGRAARR